MIRTHNEKNAASVAPLNTGDSSLDSSAQSNVRRFCNAITC